jgi:hypothetical protein
MPWSELHHTLVAAVQALSPSLDSGLVVTEASLDLPLEIGAGERDGHPVIVGGAPHSRWDAGFLPAVHFAHLSVELVDDPFPTVARRDGD